LVNQGVLKPVDRSDWCSPILLIPKPGSKGGEHKFRAVADYRECNSQIMSDNWPIQSTKKLISDIGKPVYLSSFDLSDAYHSISLSKESQNIASVICELGIFTPTRLTKGLKVSAQIFTRAIDMVFSDIK